MNVNATGQNRCAPPLPRFTKPFWSKKIASFAKRNVVMITAAVLAVVTSFIIPPDAEYKGYFDYKTLTCLFCTLAVICALKNINFFTVAARAIIRRTGNLQSAVLALVYITIVGSIFIANDLALLTFLPLGYILLEQTGMQRYMAFTFTMQNIAANLGGMIAPFGNPQSLFLYSKFSIPTGEFISIMAIPFLVSLSMITLICFAAIRKIPLMLQSEEEPKLPAARTSFYLVLFSFALIAVFDIVPYWTGLVIIPAALFAADRKALRAVDYPLLLTFVFFFIFAGNMARIEAVNNLLSSLLSMNTLVVSTLSCQFISNVPTAILLSRFTDNYRELLVGVNIGGVGTLIASLASLITFREYTSRIKNNTVGYLLQFSFYNFLFLIILLIVSVLFLQVFPLF